MSERVPLKLVEVKLLRDEWTNPDVTISSPEDAVSFMNKVMGDSDREMVSIINLSSKGKVINASIVNVGDINKSILSGGNIFRTALLSGAASFILLHNHPSGELTPSMADFTVTRNLYIMGKNLGVELQDHIIMNGRETYSIKENHSALLEGEHFLSSDLMNVSEEKNSYRSVKSYFTVYYCGEFHDMSIGYDRLKTMTEAKKIFDGIPEQFISLKPALGIVVVDEKTDETIEQFDLYNGKYINLDYIDRYESIMKCTSAHYKIAEILETFSEADVIGKVPKQIEEKREKVSSKVKGKKNLDEITKELEEGVTAVFDSDNYKTYLDMVSKLPRYSFNNTVLIATQMPEATMCQSFTAWKKMGRYVKKGEHGIKILAPAPFKVKAEHLVKDDVTGKNLLDENGKEITEEKLIDVMGFKVVYTFDVSQTEGEPIPTLGVNELKGNVEMYPEYIEILESISPCAISFMDYKGESKGYYSPSKNHIVIKDNLSELQTLKTLIHEMSHAALHNDEAMKERTIDSSQMEIEAESVAYTVCSYLGLDTSEYSFSYVAGWSKGKDISELKDSLSIIKTTASDMITKIESKLEKKVVKEESITPEEMEIDNEEEIERAVM